MQKEYCYTNWNDIPWVESREKVSRKEYLSTHGLKISQVRLTPGHQPWMHAHEKEQVIFVLRGRCRVDVDGVSYPMKERCILSVPSWAEHQVVAEDEEAVVLSIFSPASENAPESRPAEIKPQSTRVFDFDAYQWECPRPKLRRKIYQGADNFTMSLVEMDPNHEPAPHDHFYVQIVMCLDGRTVYHIDGEPLPLEAGTILTTPPDAVHYSHNQNERTVTDFEIFWPKRDDREEPLPIAEGKADE